MSTLYFVIDTDSYSGGFERPICAYMTGRIGDCEVGEKEQAIFEEEVGDPEQFEDLVGSEPDDHGVCRPAKIYPTPGWFNNGVGGHYREDEPGVMEKAQKEHDEEVRKYADETIRRCYADKVYANKTADAHIKEGVGRPITKFPAYQSVAICLNREPTEEEIVLFKARARKFEAEQKSFEGESVKISGFRLVTERTVSEERAL